MLLDERRERALGLGPDGEGDPRRDEVEDDDRRVVVAGDRVGEAERELGVRAAADRDEDPPDLLATPRCLTTAMSHGESRTTSSIVGEKTVGPVPSRPPAARPPQPKMMRSASCSADASTMPSAACRPMRTIGWIVVPSGA